MKAAYLRLLRMRERALHPSRHRAVKAKLAAMPAPRQILVVCHGNICRSPYLQAVLQRSLPGVAVSSAGFIAANRPVPPESLEVSRKRGIQLETFRSRLISAAVVGSADLIIVMEPSQGEQIGWLYGVSTKRIIDAGDLDPIAAEGRSISDPWMKPLSVFEATFNRLDRCADMLASVLGADR